MRQYLRIHRYGRIYKWNAIAKQSMILRKELVHTTFLILIFKCSSQSCDKESNPSITDMILCVRFKDEERGGKRNTGTCTGTFVHMCV
mmetsp:Transcript_15063/g.19680  ORF Transcript_15063/g.19680 Transcript_15063/m.19680 type:complete len:88 (-) Transcript_15063:12-275(-)